MNPQSPLKLEELSCETDNRLCPDLLQWASARYKHQIALQTDTQKLTFNQLDLIVHNCCKTLSDKGVKSGDHILLIADKTVETVILLLALCQLKACVCPVNPKLPNKALLSLVDALNIDSIVGDEPTLARIRTWSPKDVVELSVPSMPDRKPVWHSCDALCTMILSSGSTGQPKAVVHQYHQHVYSALASNRLVELAPEDRYLLSLPFYHIGGLQILFRCLLSGSTMVMPGNDHDDKLFNKHKITHASMVATQLWRLIHRNIPADYLKAVLVGGGPVPEELLMTTASRNIKSHLTYGLTEMCSQVVTHDTNGEAQILEHAEMKLAPDGSILVKGLGLSCGYYHHQLHPLPLDDGWFDTGDLGSWQQKRFSVHGRKDNQFISGGENVQPEEIEAFCLKISGIEQAFIVPLPDAEYGCSPVLFVNQGCKTGIEAVQTQLSKSLPGFKIPKQLFFLSDEHSLKTNRLRLAQLARKYTSQSICNVETP